MRQTMVGEPCVLINRTSDPLTVQKNGVTKIFQPGENVTTTDWIRFAKQQHARKGTAGPSGIDYDTLFAVKGVDPAEQCALIPPGQEHHGIEIFDRSHPDFDATARDVVQVATGIRPPTRRTTGAELPRGVFLNGRETTPHVEADRLDPGE